MKKPAPLQLFAETLAVGIVLTILFLIGFSVGVAYEKKRNTFLISPLPICFPEPTPEAESLERSFVGKVSYYSNEYCEKYNPDCVTASGEVFNDTDLTCACSDLFDLGEVLLVSYQDKTVRVRCNDRGSFSQKYGRVLDLSKTAFEVLSPLSKGVITAEIRKEKSG